MWTCSCFTYTYVIPREETSYRRRCTRMRSQSSRRKLITAADLIFAIWCHRPLVRALTKVSGRCFIHFKRFALDWNCPRRFGCIILGGSWESLSFFGELCSCCLCTSYGCIETRRSFHFRRSRLMGICRYRPWLQGKWILWIWKWKFNWERNFNRGKTSNSSFIYLRYVNMLGRLQNTALRERVFAHYAPSFPSYRHPGSRASQTELTVSELTETNDTYQFGLQIK